jgi:hypothetical protein
MHTKTVIFLMIGMLLVLPAGCSNGGAGGNDADAGLDAGVTDGAPDADNDPVGPSGTLIWETGKEWAICKAVNISDVTYNSFVGWATNDMAWEYYTDTNQPVWRHEIVSKDYHPQDMTSDGAHLIGADGNTIYEFEPASVDPVRSYSAAGGEDVYNIMISDDGGTIYYVSGVIYDHMRITSLDQATSSENWSHELSEGGYAVGVVSKNNERLVISQYYRFSVYSNGGEELLAIETQTSASPAISHDGNILVTGDLQGYVKLYEYSESEKTYNERWSFRFEPGEYDDWAYVVAISGDGSTIAVGSVDLGDGTRESFTGELAVFDSGSNEPLWVYKSNDYSISAVDISLDGEVIAAASPGPFEDENNDFWVFEKKSSIPFFEHNCMGSINALDLSDDGSRCIAGGKAVHSGEPGNGGKLYYFGLN